MSLWHDLRVGLAELLWPMPPGCLWCRAPLGGEEGLCPSCQALIAAGPLAGVPQSPLGQVLAVAPYEAGLGEAIRMLKYGRRHFLAATLGAALAQAAGAAYPRGGVTLVPVPLHPHRLRERGFNQSELLARAVAERLSWPLEAAALRRLRSTRAQAKLGRAERQANLAGAFAVDPAWQPPPRLVLIDDVYTTGATTAACAEALLAAGAERVDALTLALER
ncbi:MAG: ComF family protein [Symbiobacteriia bacterium]